jgi:hypothetical protein
VKVAPSPGRAARLDRAAVQLDELPADRQAQAEAAELPAEAGVGLAERREDVRQELRRDADARCR